MSTENNKNLLENSIKILTDLIALKQFRVKIIIHL